MSEGKKVPLHQIKDNLSVYLREAEKEQIIITRHGKPAGVLIGFETEDDWFDYKLEHDPRFLARVERARKAFREGKGIRFEDIKWDDEGK
ncbi:MAG: type II toxin-antitoxin system Phd/YefM family antitoxin [Chloroflexota bacterium]